MAAAFALVRFTLMTQALIFANGDFNDGAMVRRAFALAMHSRIIAADGGARAAMYFGYLPQVVIGDLDSLSAVEVTSLESQGVEIHKFPTEKIETDLELALKYAVRQECTWIRVIGGVGDRLDQTMANVYLLTLPELQGRDVAMVAAKQEIRLLGVGDHHLRGQAGDTLSLIPMAGAVHGIRTLGLYYPLRDETLFFGPTRGVSNVFSAEEAQITVREGLLLAVHTVGRA